MIDLLASVYRRASTPSKTSGLPDFRTSGLCLSLFLSLSAPTAFAEDHPGKSIFAIYCAACHGAEGAGLVGPNLTDKVFVHGDKQADILRVVSTGVGDKGMPAWSAILLPPQIEQVSEFAFSLIGKNLKSPFAPGQTSVTPFPKGSKAFPLVMRTFMTTAGINSDVFAHHHKGEAVAKYNPDKGMDVDGTANPIDGVPSAMAVNFGEDLSYCFDTTECRLLYTWSGPFMDMTRYWGPDSGGGRESNGYVPVVTGRVGYRTAGPEPVSHASKAAPRFLGYSKIKGVPILNYALGAVTFSVRIEPGEKPGVARCFYTTSGAAEGLTMTFAAENAAQITADKGTRVNNVLTLKATEAASFVLTIIPTAEPIHIPIPAAKPKKAKTEQPKKED